MKKETIAITTITTVTTEELSKNGFVLPRELKNYMSFGLCKELRYVINDAAYKKFINATRPQVVDIKKTRDYARPYLSMDMVKSMQKQEVKLLSENCNSDIIDEIVDFEEAKWNRLNEAIKPYFRGSNALTNNLYNALILNFDYEFNTLSGKELGLVWKQSALDELRKYLFDAKAKKYRSATYFRGVLLNIIAENILVNTRKVSKKLLYKANSMTMVVNSHEYSKISRASVKEYALKYLPKKFKGDKFNRAEALCELVKRGYICLVSDEALDFIRNNEVLKVEVEG